MKTKTNKLPLTMAFKRRDYACECSDKGCKHCKGECKAKRSSVYFRVDMEDKTGVRFCVGCAADAESCGLFYKR